MRIECASDARRMRIQSNLPPEVAPYCLVFRLLGAMECVQVVQMYSSHDLTIEKLYI